jgi:transposase
METPTNISYIKRTQKYYSLSFKLQVVEEIESGQLDRLHAHFKYGVQARSTITAMLRKYSAFVWENLSIVSMFNTSEQKSIELEAKVKLLEKQKARAAYLTERADKKVIVFDMLFDLAEKEYDIEIRKNYKPELSKTSKKNIKKQ